MLKNKKKLYGKAGRVSLLAREEGERENGGALESNFTPAKLPSRLYIYIYGSHRLAIKKRDALIAQIIAQRVKISVPYYVTYGNRIWPGLTKHSAHCCGM